MCNKKRVNKHDWSKDCKECSICGLIRSAEHNWRNDCEKCSVCGKTQTDKHNWKEDCEICSVCNKKRVNKHDWSKDCNECSICGLIRSAEHNWRNDCEKCSVCGKIQTDKHNWKEDCEKCSICGTIRYGKHKWYGRPEKCSICGVLPFKIIEWDQNSDTLLLFHWKKFEFEGKIIFRRVRKEIKIILQSIYGDFTETYAPTSKRVVEKDLEWLAPFLEQFIQNDFWFMAKPQYIHDSIKSFFIEQINQIDTSKLSQRDSHYLESWHKILDNKR